MPTTRPTSILGSMAAGPTALPDIERRFRGAIAEAAGLDPVRFDRPGTSVVSSPERKGWRTASAHALGPHTLIWTDPDITDRVAPLADDVDSFSIDTLEAWAAANHAVFLGGAWGFLSDSSMLGTHLPPEGSQFVRLDRDNADDRALIGDLVDASDPDDLEAAEVALHALDHLIVGLTDSDGRLAAFASARPWEYDAVFGNIAVLVRADKRRGDWGGAAVTALCPDTFQSGRLPLYRCNWEREPSRRLALSVGFRQVNAVAAVRFV